MAGRCAARVLADRFTNVVVVDRDCLVDDPPLGGWCRQGRRPHLLLTAAAGLVHEWFPGLTAELYDAGAVELDLCGEFLGTGVGERSADPPRR
jgi:hypothetical protein